MKYALAIDIGASSGRHILAHTEGGRLITEEIYRFENGFYTVEKEGATECYWDLERLFSEIKEGLRRAGALGKAPVSIGIDTWGVDYVLLDGEGRALADARAYRDSRTERSSALVHERVPFERLFSRTGIQFNTFNTVYQLYDDKLKGRLDNAAHLLMLPDYFHYRLTGVMRQEYTNATTTALVNAVSHTFDRELIDLLGLPAHLFGELSQPGETVGRLLPEIREELGFDATVVLPATHDTASAVIGAPIGDGVPYISSGTWSLLGIEVDHAYTDGAARENNYSNEGSLAFRFRLQKNIMGLWLINQVRRELPRKYSFDELVGMARENPIPDLIDAEDARFLSPKSMIREIEDAVGRALSVGELAHVIYHSLAVCYAKSLTALEEMTGDTYETLHIIGGGSKNAFLNELTEKETGKRVLAGPGECTALGNLLVQLIRLGEIDTVASGREMIKHTIL